MFDPEINSIHFVYAYKFKYQFPYFKFVNHIIKKMLESPFFLDRTSFKHKLLYNPIPAPYSITYNVFNSLEQKYKIVLYDAGEQITIRPKKGDIIIGHLLEDSNTVFARSLNNPDFYKKIALQPFTTDKSILFLEKYLDKLDQLLFICGDYWKGKLQDLEKFYQIKDKISFIEMPVDTTYYPFFKISFNPKNERVFFYIGREGYDKGTDILKTLPELIPGFKGYYIGNIEMNGWTQITKYAALDESFARKNFANLDFFINLSRIDAQATTIGEAMAWGFPVVCTPQSGYDNIADIINVDYSDPDSIVNAYNYLQSAEEADLLKIAYSNRRYVETNLNWSVFIEKVKKTLI